MYYYQMFEHLQTPFTKRKIILDSENIPNIMYEFKWPFKLRTLVNQNTRNKI